MGNSYATTSSLIDPDGASALVAAVNWLQGTLLGTIATTVAVIAVAGIGFCLLTGRIDVRKAITTLIGCFIIFGASSVVVGLRGLSDGVSSGPVGYQAAPATPLPPFPPGFPYDPYAGASVRSR